MALIGFETQTHETKVFPTGIQRVIRETHQWVTDFLGADGIDVGWVNTVDRPRAYGFKSHPYLASDPVLNGPEAKLSEIDVLVILDLSMMLDVRAVVHEKQSRGLKVVVLIHDILPISHPEWFPADAERIYRLFLQRMLHIADHVVLTSEFVRSELLGLQWSIAGEIHVIRLGSLHPPRPASRVPQSEIALISVSTVEPRKGHRRLLGAFDVLRQQGRDVNLHLVGKPGWAEQSLYREINDHPDFGARLRWHRNASDLDVLNLAGRSNIAVIPSDEEGFGMFLEEALTLGLKVVASDIPVFREREQPNVFFANLTAQGFAEAILEASRAPWVDIYPIRVRSMRDFGADFSNLLHKCVIEDRVSS